MCRIPTYVHITKLIIFTSDILSHIEPVSAGNCDGSRLVIVMLQELVCKDELGHCSEDGEF